MKCEDLQLNLPVYTDDILTEDERAALEAHLSSCPVCRHKLADFQTLRNSLRGMARAEMPPRLLESVRINVAAQLQTASPKSNSLSSKNFWEWIQMRVMPYGIGTFASLILGFTLLWSLLAPASQTNRTNDLTQSDSFSNSTVLLANANPKGKASDYELSPTEYARTRSAFSGESPSINPQGALVALTKSLMRGDMKDEEVVVVADVFGNGLAQIAEVVEPSSRNRQAVQDLENALRDNPEYAPFVPADLDRRSESIRIVFKIQSVNVKTNLKSVHQ
jgi:hypothetical protein